MTEAYVGEIRMWGATIRPMAGCSATARPCSNTSMASSMR